MIQYKIIAHQQEPIRPPSVEIEKLLIFLHSLSSIDDESRLDLLTLLTEA